MLLGDCGGLAGDDEFVVDLDVGHFDLLLNDVLQSIFAARSHGPHGEDEGGIVVVGGDAEAGGDRRAIGVNSNSNHVLPFVLVGSVRGLRRVTSFIADGDFTKKSVNVDLDA